MNKTIREQVAKKANQVKVERLEHLRDEFMNLLGSRFGLSLATLVKDGLIVRLSSCRHGDGIQIRLTDALYVSAADLPASRWSMVVHDWEELHEFFQTYSDGDCIFPGDIAVRYYSSYLVDTDDTNKIVLL
jgi:hypothetical protein